MQIPRSDGNEGHRCGVLDKPSGDMRPNPTRRKFLASVTTTLVATKSMAGVGPTIATVVGTGEAGMVADGESVKTAKLNNPFGVLIGPDGDLYWADFASNRVLKLGLRTQRVSLIAGTGEKGHGGDGGPAKQANLSAPHEVHFDRDGNLFIAERDSNVVRCINGKTGIISTIAGTGVRRFSGDGGPATLAQLAQPHSIALDKSDNLYICDILNNRIRLRDPGSGIIMTFAGTGEAAVTPDKAPLSATPLLFGHHDPWISPPAVCSTSCFAKATKSTQLIRPNAA